MIKLDDILDYEIRSSIWACYISNEFLQKLSGKYFAWKCLRKYKRYKNSMELKQLIKNAQ